MATGQLDNVSARILGRGVSANIPLRVVTPGTVAMRVGFAPLAQLDRATEF